jgi:CelD/BcsL family acetyltransferase involved in cellulose biosynthesis
VQGILATDNVAQGVRHDGGSLERIEGFASSAAAWSELAERSGSIFATPEWLEAWWRHYGRGRPLALWGWRRDGELAAVLPLYVFRARGPRVLRFLGHGPGDQLGPVFAPGDEDAAAAALRLVLAEERTDALVAERLPGGTGWRERLGASVLEREPSPVVRFNGLDWDGYLAGRSKHMREEVRRHERKLRREHDVRIRLSTDPDRFEEDVELLFRLHAMRWRDAGSEFCTVDAPFQREILRMAFDRGWLLLTFLEVDGETAAAAYGFRFGRADAYYQGGWDARFAQQRVGNVIVAHVLRSAIEAGREEFHFLRGGEAYKFRYATDDPGVESLLVGRGAIGRAATVAARVRHSWHARRSASAA